GEVIFYGVGGVWRTDGTSEGTVLVKRLAIAAGFVPLGRMALFRGSDERGGELWRTDGTTEGTVLVKDINPGVPTAVRDDPVQVGEIAMFVAEDVEHGFELWRSDGTYAGTQLVKDILPGTGSGLCSTSLTAVDGRVFFAPGRAREGDSRADRR